MANTKITSRVIADDAILTANIADDQITSALIADDVALGGNPTTSTQTAGNNTTRIATTAFVSTAVANIVNSAPATLDTLGEIATALNNDAALNTTLTNSIAAKLPLAGGTMTGNIAHAGNFTLDVGGEIRLSADDNGEIHLYDGSLHYGSLLEDNSNLIIQSIVQDEDILFKGDDGGSVITALTLDMSKAGAATFNSTINDLTLSAGEIATDAANNFRLNTPNSMRINIDSDGNSSGEVFQIGHDQTAINDSNVLFRVQENGNVGIGTTSPARTLHVNSADANVASFEGHQGEGVVISSGTNGQIDIIGYDDGASAYNPILIRAATTGLYISTAGSIGIGRTPEAYGSNRYMNLQADAGGDATFNLQGDTTNGGKLSLIAKNDDTAVVMTETNHPLIFGTNQAEKMRIEANGIVHITSGALRIAPTIAHGGGVGDLAKLRVINRSGQGADKGGLIEFGGVTDDGVSRADVFGAIAGLKTNSSSGHREGYMAFYTNDGDSLDEQMRISSEQGGLLLIGDTVGYSGGHDAVSRLQLTGGGSVLAIRQSQVTDSSHRVVAVFTDANGTYRGRITVNNSSCSFTAASDYRLKENIEPLPNGLDRLKQLKPVKFKWKEHDYTSEGFIAHEVQEIYPEAVVGEKDDEVMQSIDYGKITPLLVKAIQEQQTIIEALEARIKVLEG